MDQQRSGSEPAPDAITGIAPRGEGHSFVWYGDSFSGVPGRSAEANFADVNRIFQRIAPWPSHLVVVGDHIVGGPAPADAYRGQWRYWLDAEMGWFQKRSIPNYHIPSNHNTFDEVGEQVFRETFPDLPGNGPDDQVGLAYWVRHGSLLMVFTDTNFSGLGGTGHLESDWLDHVLTEQADATQKLVFGHHPVLPVNGHAEYPMWRVIPAEGERFWSVLVRHGVLAYVCSHILAFDMRAASGVLQVLTGGAGAIPLMPEATEYHHLVQGAIDEQGLRLQALDVNGHAREWLSWPLTSLPEPRWALLTSDAVPLAPRCAGESSSEGRAWFARLRLRGNISGVCSDHQTFLSGFHMDEGPATLWIGLRSFSNRLTVRLVHAYRRGVQEWEGPVIPSAGSFEIELGIHSGMGPGGILWRPVGGDWSSLSTPSAWGVERMRWPENWSIGHARSGPDDEPCQAHGLEIWYDMIEEDHRSLLDE